MGNIKIIKGVFDTKLELEHASVVAGFPKPQPDYEMEQLNTTKMMNMDNQQEIFPIVDEGGKVIGSATRGECHSGSKLLHPVVHLHVFNSKGDIYL